MGAASVYSGFCNETHFEYNYRLFEDDNETKRPATFDFVTSEGNEFQISWKIVYSLKLEYLEEDIYSLTKIDASPKKQLNSGDVAFFKVSVGKHECLNTMFDSKSPLNFVEKIKGLSIQSLLEPEIHIEVKVYHQNRCVTKMVQDYDDFLENESLRDVTFVVGNEKILAHKQILSARNAVFASMFDSDMLEKKNSQVEITDVEPPIFQLFLNFIYNGKVDTRDLENWLKLIVVADKYSMVTLVSFCEDYLAGRLTVDNVIDVFVIADMVKSKVLKGKCMSFMFENKHGIINTNGYQNLVTDERADLLSEMHCFILGEIIQNEIVAKSVKKLKI